MSGEVTVEIVSARDLLDANGPICVQIRLGGQQFSTRNAEGIAPQWDSDGFKFEVDETVQDEPIEIQVTSDSKSIGKTYIELKTLFLTGACKNGASKNTNFSGWIPIHNTSGITGEVNIIITPTKSPEFAGVLCLHSPLIPHGFNCDVIHGFVEEIVTNPKSDERKFNETLFHHLSGELQRKIGAITTKMGGNAIIGYTQTLDFDCQTNIIFRGFGTAVTLSKTATLRSQKSIENSLIQESTRNYLSFLGVAKGMFTNSGPNSPSHLPPLPSPITFDTNFQNIIDKPSFLLGDESDKNETDKPKMRRTSLEGNVELTGTVDETVACQNSDKMKKSPRLTSLSNLEAKSNLAGTKFTSLHNIHDACSKINEYSAHHGKDTVLGDLFHRMDKNRPTSLQRFVPQPMNSGFNRSLRNASELPPNSPFRSINRHSIHGTKTCSRENVLGRFFRRMHHKKTPHSSPMYGKMMFKSPTTVSLAEMERSLSMGTKFTSLHNIHDVHCKINDYSAHKGKGTVLGELFRRVDSRIMPSPTESMTMLSNNIADLEEEEENIGIEFNVSNKNIEPSNGHVESKTCEQNEANDPFDFKSNTPPKSNQSTPVTTPGSSNPIDEDKCSVTSKDKHGIMTYIKDGKDKLMHGLHAKSSERSSIKHEHGLLGTALGNVLMDSANEIMVTSHVEEAKSKKNSESPIRATSEEKTDLKLTMPKRNSVFYRDLDGNEIPDVNTASTFYCDLDSPDLQKEFPTHHPQQTEQKPASPNKNNIFAAPKKFFQRFTKHEDAGSDSVNDGATPKDTKQEKKSDSGFLQSGKERILRGSKHLLHKIDCKIHKKSDDGLLKCALGNVLMESLNDALVTPQTPSPTSPQFPSVNTLEARNILEHHTRLSDNFQKLDTPFLTMSKYPAGFIRNIGGVVSTHVVKPRPSTVDENCVDGWLADIHNDINARCKDFGCNTILGYKEAINFCGDVCLLSAMGTAANVNTVVKNKAAQEGNQMNCGLCHSSNAQTNTSQCRICRNGNVPDMIITNIEIPDEMPCLGKGCMVQSYTSSDFKDHSEINDKISSIKNKLEHLLVTKLRIKAMNAVFGLKIRITVGSNMLVGTATGTAVYLTSLPPPSLPRLIATNEKDFIKMEQFKKTLHDIVKQNQQIYHLGDEINATKVYELKLDNEEVINCLLDPRPPDGFHVVNIETLPGFEHLHVVKSLEMFMETTRIKLQSQGIDKQFQKLLESLYFKLRRKIPCAICDLQFRVAFSDEIQLSVLGMALGFGDPKMNTKEDCAEDNSKKDCVAVDEHDQKKIEVSEIEITSSTYIPDGVIDKYLGSVNLSFLRVGAYKCEEDGLMDVRLVQILKIVQAYIAGLGGNAMVSYYVSESRLNSADSREQYLFNIGGDVVYVSYFLEDN